MVDAQVELLQRVLKTDRQVAEEEPQRLDPSCDVCSEPVKLNIGAVWVDRLEIFNSELDIRLKPETDQAIDMRNYSAPQLVHIYFGHLDCQGEQVQNSYSAETYLMNPCSFMDLSAHLFTKRWFKHSDYPGFARKWSKRFWVSYLMYFVQISPGVPRTIRTKDPAGEVGSLYIWS